MRKKFVIVIASTEESQGVTEFPMKSWLRENPDNIPDNIDVTTLTSRQILSVLKKHKWNYIEDETHVRLTLPNCSTYTDLSPSSLDDCKDETESKFEDYEFSLENQLRDFLEENLRNTSIENGSLKIYIDPSGRDGVEYPTDVGFIDILAVNEKGDFYIIELKKGISSDKTIGQITRYMGWVKSTLGKNNNVYGIIVSKTANDKLKYSKMMVPNISIYEYRLNVQFDKI